MIPLQFVSAQTLIKLLDNYAAKPGTVRAEPSRNLIIIQGNSADRRAAIQTVLSFDADWMLGQSVGIYPVSNSTPEPVIAELNRIIDCGAGWSQSRSRQVGANQSDRTPFSSLRASRSYSKGWPPGSRGWTNRAVRALTSKCTACAMARRVKSRLSSTICSSARTQQRTGFTDQPTCVRVVVWSPQAVLQPAKLPQTTTPSPTAGGQCNKRQRAAVQL